MKAEIRASNTLITKEATGVWLATGDAAIFVSYEELFILGCMLHTAYLVHLAPEFETAKEDQKKSA